MPTPRYPKFPELGVITVRTEDGLHVIDVDEDSPAAAAGIETGDTLTRLDDTSLRDRSDLGRALAELSWGDVPSITLIRDNESRTIELALRR